MIPFVSLPIRDAKSPIGIGLMMARALADGGAAKVYIVGRRVEVLEKAAKSINKPDVVVPLAGDVSSQSSLASLVSEIEKSSGYLNLLVCNSGITGPKVPQPGPGESLQEWRERNLAVPMEEYNSTFNVNTTAVWYTALEFLDLLDKGNKKGNLGWQSQVVVTSSIGGFNRKAPGGWAYGQSKAAVTHLTKQLAVVLPKWGIRYVSESEFWRSCTDEGGVAERTRWPRDCSLARCPLPISRRWVATDLCLRLTTPIWMPAWYHSVGWAMHSIWLGPYSI